MAEQVPTESAPLQKNRFGGIIENWARNFMDPSFDPTRGVDFFFNQLRINAGANMSLFLQFLDLAPRSVWDISPYLDRLGSTPKQGEYFDSARGGINDLISQLFRYPPNQTAKEKERMMKSARLIYSHIIGSYIGKSLSVGDPVFKKSLRGVAWSVLAKDIDKTLVPNGQKRLSPKWRNQMRGMIFSDKTGMEAVAAELKKFEQGNDEVF